MKNITKIRRMVATMANRLKKMGLTLSAAFKRAWELVKGNTIETKIAGVTKGSRQRALHRIATKYSPDAVSVRLERDTANLYDNHAVKVIISVNDSEAYNLGYIPRNLAYVVSAILDKGIKLTRFIVSVCRAFTLKTVSTLYCDRPSPQAENWTCKEYSSRRGWYEKQQQNEISKLHRNIYQQKQMLAKRNPDITEYRLDFESFKTASKEWKRKVKSGEAAESDYLQWLKDVKEKKVTY